MENRVFYFDSYVTQGEEFHFARKPLDQRRPQYTHSHDYFEMFLIERGAATHLINDHSERLERGALVFVRPEDRHCFRAARETGCQIINVMFRPDTAAHLVDRYGDELAGRFFWKEGGLPDTYLLQGPRLERAINSSVELQASRRTLARIEQFLLYFMTRVIDHVATLPRDTPRWLVAACQASRAPEVFRKGAAGFVEVAGRGHEHVCRMSQRHLGLSPSAYVNRVRMEHAAMLLGRADAPIPEVAMECGIENMSHFYKLFREIYGTTPNQYRKRHRRDEVAAF